MPFGPMNTPVIYTCMMQVFHAEWDLLFILTNPNTTKIGREPFHVTDTNDIHVGNMKT